MAGTAVSLAILGKNEEPLYLKEFTDSIEDVSDSELFGLGGAQEEDDDDVDAAAAANTKKFSQKQCSLRQQFILHAALDRFEQLNGPPPGYAWRKQGVAGTDAMFVGCLAPVENYRVYGYMTTTQIRFLLVVQDHDAPQQEVDEKIKRLMVQLHRLYVEYTLNPFGTIESSIQSPLFEKRVEECVGIFNRNI